jgi:hypothetical protein
LCRRESPGIGTAKGVIEVRNTVNVRYSPVIGFFSIVFVAVGLLVSALLAWPASADLLHAETLPLRDEGEANWVFFGDTVLGLHSEMKRDSYLGYLNAYSLPAQKFAWRFVLPLGDKDLDITTRGIPDFENNRLYIGTGQLSLLDVSTGTFKWIIPCETLGFIQPGATVLLPGDRLLTLGAKECKQKSAYARL